ncbi:phage minor capsid protein [Lapidilactobacillus gannanensis]|uniref:Phage minor capsid protein n=1 Tax=Lapidilactobacillus gannanensis TaxID=2486002 RepID=A0ABW4BMS0_9LACO|nr:phage minor capsid protein [Lapidilactobacillus gannanensis]
MKTSPHQLDLATSQIQDVYQALEQEIFEMFCDRLKSKGLTEDNVLQWQTQKLGELHLVNSETIKLVSKATGIARPLIAKLFNDLGVQVYEDSVNRIKQDKGSASSTNVIDAVMSGYVKQIFLDLDNNVNQTLITTNFGEHTPVTDTYQQIIKETTGKVIAGLKTPDKVLAETVYKWRDAGLLSGFTDKGGHHWTIDSYARTVIGTTASRAFQAARDQAAEDNNIDTFVMSSHPASRPACAPIQGKLVTTQPNGFYAADEWFEPLDNHGYGSPGGTFGINCRHIKWPYIPGVNSNNQPQYDAAMAIKNGNIQQKQRGLERDVRRYKNMQQLATDLEDDIGVKKYSQLVRGRQAALRQLVNQNGFLARDYSRERSFGYSSRETSIIKKRSSVNEQMFNRHIVNTHEYVDHWKNLYNKAVKRAAKSGKDTSLVKHYSPSELFITEKKASELVSQYGILDLTTRTRSFEHTSNIGIYVDEKTGERLPTRFGLIVYRKNGFHIRPLDPRKEHIND